MANGSVPFGHQGFSDRAEGLRASMSVSYAGENVAYNKNLEPVESAVTGWLNSPGHRKNIEVPEFAKTGIGVIKGSDGSYYLTQIFVSP